MRIPLLLLIVSFASVGNLLAQAENTAPIVWERYRIPRKDLSVMLPKLPTASGAVDTCNEIERSSYFAYADGATYEISIVAKLKRGSRPDWCKSFPGSATPATIEQRLDEIRGGKEKPVESTVDVPGVNVYRFVTERTTRQVFSDTVKRRWIELVVSYYADAKPEVDHFLGSLQFSAAGKEIDDGAKWTLGDPMDEDSRSTVQQNSKDATDDKKEERPENRVQEKSTDKFASLEPTDLPPGSSALFIAAKPRATYTDSARRANVQGSVRLKATLLKNGAVGTITVIKDLPHGLTDQAIYAARRIVFLPKKVDNEPVNSVITLEYGFSIY
ncbi:MAG TPA: energy transducer TonB [Pyrinomonadaceae bacterium]